MTATATISVRIYNFQLEVLGRDGCWQAVTTSEEFTDLIPIADVVDHIEANQSVVSGPYRIVVREDDNPTFSYVRYVNWN